MASDRYASIPYNPNRTVEAGGGGGTMMNVRANANDFGAQVGGALQDAGAEFKKDVDHQLGMIYETSANTAEADYIKASGELTAAYRSKQGLEAQAALPQYKADLAKLRQSLMETLPGPAARVFEMTTAKQEAYAFNDANSYGIAQVKAATLNSNNAIADLAISRAGSAGIADNDARFGETIGDIQHSVNSMMELQGYGRYAKADANGKITFDDTPEGKQASVVYQSEMDKRLGAAWTNRIESLSSQNVMTAYKVYQDNKSQIPGETQVKMDAYFTPKIRDYQTRTIADDTISAVDADYKAKVLTPNSGTVATIMKNEIAADGVVSVHTDGDGQAIGGINSNSYPAQFAEAKKILDEKGQEAAKEYINNFYQKEIVDKNGITSLPKNVQTIVADGLANHWSGFQKELLDAAKNGATPEQLIDMRRKEYQRLATENPAKYGKNLEGWNNRLDKLSKEKPIETTGLVPSQADYYRSNFDDILEKTRKDAEALHPDDPAFADNAVARVTQRMNQAIHAQEVSYKADGDLIMRAVNGEVTKGARPMSIEQLRATNPEVAQAWDRFTVNNPQAASVIENRILTANSKETDKDLKEGGSKFYDFYKRALKAPGDPDRPTPLQVMQAVGDGLTLKGQKEILGMLDGKNDGNEKYVNNAVDFMKNKIIGILDEKDPQVKEKLAKMTFDVRNAVAVGLAQGKTIETLTDPASKDFVGLVAKDMIPDDMTLAQQILYAAEPPVSYSFLGLPFAYGMFDSAGGEVDFEKNVDKAVEEKAMTPQNGWKLLRQAVIDGMATKEEATRIAKKHGFVKQPNVLYTPEEKAK